MKRPPLKTRFAKPQRPRWPSCRMGGRITHPGEFLAGILKPADISQNSLARRLRVPPRRINEIILGKRGITPETALGLAEALGFSEYYWLGLQMDYDLERARERYIRLSLGGGDWGPPPSWWDW